VAVVADLEGLYIRLIRAISTGTAYALGSWQTASKSTYSLLSKRKCKAYLTSCGATASSGFQYYIASEIVTRCTSLSQMICIVTPIKAAHGNKENKKTNVSMRNCNGICSITRIRQYDSGQC
jgi:hypothetical protein